VNVASLSSKGLVAFLMLASAGSAGAKEAARFQPVATPAQSVSVSVAYSLNLPLSEGAVLVDAANNRAYRRSLYQKAEEECADFLATIAKACSITNINVSTAENRYVGQPATLYVSVNVSMQIELK
jgi:hypothetical protein